MFFMTPQSGIFLYTHSAVIKYDGFRCILYREKICPIFWKWCSILDMGGIPTAFIAVSSSSLVTDGLLLFFLSITKTQKQRRKQL